MSSKQINRKTGRNQRSYDWCKKYVTGNTEELRELICQCNDSPQIVHKIARKLRGIVIECRTNIAQKQTFDPARSTTDQIEEQLYKELLDVLDGVISVLSAVHPTLHELSAKIRTKHLLQQHIMRRPQKHRLNDAIAMRMMLKYLCGKTRDMKS